LYFLDLEASSLDSGSFPIEVGWVDEAGQGESYLIRPEGNWIGWTAWPWPGWSDASEKLHGISRDLLTRDGQPAATIAARAHDTLSGHVICSDNPAFDEYWLGMLLRTGGYHPLPISKLDKMIWREVHRILPLVTDAPDMPPGDRQAQNLLHQGRIFVDQTAAREAKRRRVRHRALPDAEGLWWQWHQVRDWVDRRLASA
jgi:hypothetical protein